MDFDLNGAQRERIDKLQRLIESNSSRPDTKQLDVVLLASDVHHNATVLDRFLITEELARRGLRSGYGLYCLMSDLLPPEVPAGQLAVMDAKRIGPVRFADPAALVVQISEQSATVHQPQDTQVRAANAAFGYPYAYVSTGAATTTLNAAPEMVRARWRLTLIAEIAGNAHTAITRTAEHLNSRRQFGRPLATFQALRHRLAEAAVSAEATRWLGREAAFHDDPRSVLLAARYACDTAAKLVPELVQMCGARAFTFEFGLHNYTMRMNCLRLELGGIDRLGDELSGSAPAQREPAVAARSR